MENTRTIARVFLGILIAACGLALILLWTPKKKLGEDLAVIPLLSALAPHYYIYLKVNAVLYLLSGIMVTFKLPFGSIFYFLGSMMFMITYDNPLLATNVEIAMTRFIYAICHIIILITLLNLNDTSYEEKEEKINDQEGESTKKQVTKEEEPTDGNEKDKQKKKKKSKNKKD